MKQPRYSGFPGRRVPLSVLPELPELKRAAGAVVAGAELPVLLPNLLLPLPFDLPLLYFPFSGASG